MKMLTKYQIKENAEISVLNFPGRFYTKRYNIFESSNYGWSN